MNPLKWGLISKRQHKMVRPKSNLLLCVDDEISLDIILKLGMKNWISENNIGYNFSRSVDSALEYLSDCYQDYSDRLIILSDINMPEKDGFDLLKMVAEKFPEAKVIMFSASSDKSKMDKAQKLGALDYITKPLDLDSLQRRLDKIIHETAGQEC